MLVEERSDRAQRRRSLRRALVAARAAADHPCAARRPHRPPRAGRARRRRGGRRGRQVVRRAARCSSWSTAPTATALDAQLRGARAQAADRGGRRAPRRASRPSASRQSLVRDVAYEGMLKARRADLHARYADWVERDAGERAGEYDEILGYHLERALPLPRPSSARSTSAAASWAPAPPAGSARPADARSPAATSGPPSACSSGPSSLLDADDPARRELTLELQLGAALRRRPGGARGSVRGLPRHGRRAARRRALRGR